MVAPNRQNGGARDHAAPTQPFLNRQCKPVEPSLTGARTEWDQAPFLFQFLRDASRLGLLFVVIALVNLLVLLLALWLLRYGATDPAVPILDPIPRG
jgi:hypothetical protein